MIRIAIICLALLSHGVCHSQYYLRAFTYRPTGYFGSVMKPTYSLEAGKNDNFSEGKIRLNYAANFMIFSARQDTFRTYGVIYDPYTGTRVVPGYEIVGKYILLNGYVGGDWSPVSFGNVYPYIGGDFQIGFYRYKNERYTEEIANISESTLGVLFGARLRMGIEYEHSDDFTFFLNANRQGWFNLSPAFFCYGWDLGLGVKYSM